MVRQPSSPVERAMISRRPGISGTETAALRVAVSMAWAASASGPVRLA